MLRTLSAAFLLAAATLVTNVQPAKPQDAAVNFPSRNLELVVPFPAGGTADVIARVSAQGAAAAWGKTIVIQNKAGATGAIAAEYVANAAPDGYTLLMATGSTHTINPAYRKDLPFDPIKNFAPVTLLVVVPNVLVVNPKKVPVKSVAEFIQFLKDNPGKLNFGSSGVGGGSHFAGELFMLMTNTKMTHVPYRGSAPALTDLVGGNVDVLIDNISTVWPQVREGNIRALGIATQQRSPLAPELPTIAETVPGFEAVSWNGIVAPAGTPEAIVEKLSRAFGASVHRPEVVKQFQELGAPVVGGTSEEFKRFIAEDLARWARVARDTNLFAK